MSKVLKTGCPKLANITEHLGNVRSVLINFSPSIPFLKYAELDIFSKYCVAGNLNPYAAGGKFGRYKMMQKSCKNPGM